jgi:hypothetical protein
MALETSETTTPSASSEPWKPPDWFIWGVVWIALLVAPQPNNLFQFIATSQSAYGELRLSVGNEVVVVAKNSGAGAVRFVSTTVQKHFCLGIVDENAFAPTTAGLIPPATYSVALLPHGGREQPRLVYADGEAEVQAGRLRIMTPIEELQYGFGAIIVVGMLLWVVLQLHEWHLRDAFAMTGRK